MPYSKKKLVNVSKAFWSFENCLEPQRQLRAPISTPKSVKTKIRHRYEYEESERFSNL